MQENQQSRDVLRGGSGRSGGRGRGGRPSRRGHSRSSHQNPAKRRAGRNKANSNEMFNRYEKLPEKPSIWQKILSFFGLGKKKSKSSNRSSGVRDEKGHALRSDKPERPRREHESRSSHEPRPARPPREPEPIVVTTPRLYVSNLSYQTSESDLFELFNGIGKVKNAEVVYDRRTQRSKGFAYVEMLSIEDALRAVEELNTKEFMGRPLAINGARSKGPGPREEAARVANTPADHSAA